MYHKDIDEVKERYDYDSRKFEHYSMRWRDLVQASVQRPGMEHLWEVLHVYAVLGDHKVRCDGLEFFSDRFEKGRNDIRLVLFRHPRNEFPWLDPDCLERYEFWGKRPGNVVQRGYGKARQWLKEVVLTPPDPYKYIVVSQSWYKTGVYHQASLGSLGIR